MSAEITQLEPKKAAPEARIKDVITLTARLAQLLAEEVDGLTAMDLQKVETLQQEKIYITNLLEAQRKLLDKNPQIRETIPSQDRQDLQEVIGVFNDILEENHRKLLMFKEVNHKIVQAITQVVKESTLSRTYGSHGATDIAPFETLSVTLNKRI